MAHSGHSIETLLSHREWVRALARRLVRSDAEVDDLEQLAWMAALRQPRLAPETLRAWLSRVVRNLVVDRARERTRRARHERNAARPEATGSAAATVARAEAHRLVVEAVMAIEEPCRTALLLRFFEDLPPREIARRLGCDVEAVRTRIRRGLERVRERLGPRMEPALAPLLVAPALLRKGILAMSMKKTAAAAALAIAVTGAGLAVAARERGAAPGRAVEGGARASAPPAGEAEVSRGDAAELPQEARDLLVRLRREDAGGLGGARLFHIDMGGALLARASAGADGSARFERHADGSFVVAILPGVPPVAAAVDPGASAAELVAPAGAALEGALVVDDAPPEGPVAIALETGAAVAALPAPARTALERLGLRPDVAEARTAPDGSFRFEGLAPLETVLAILPDDLVLEEGGRVRPATLPSPFLLLRAHALPRLRGRIVFAGSGEGVPRALLGCRWSAGPRSGTLGKAAGEDGSFDFALPERAMSEVSLSFASEFGLGETRRELGALGKGVHDLGDLAIPAMREGAALLRLVDEAGRPVAGATARAGSAVARAFEPAGPDGLLRLPVCEAGYVARIEAAGFDPLERRIDVAGEWTVAMARATLLLVRVEAPGGAAGLLLRLDAEAPLLGRNGEIHDDDRFSECYETDEGCWYSRPLDEGGETRIHGLAAGTPFTLSCIDAFGLRHALERVQLEPKGGATVTLRIGSPARSVRGVVRGPDGAPIAWAVVTGWAGDRPLALQCAATDAEGRFALPGARTAEVRLLVAATGFEPLALASVETLEGEQEFRLRPGRRVRLRIETKSGVPLEGAEVRVRSDGLLPPGCPRDVWIAAETGPGLYELDGLPSGEVAVVVATEDGTEEFTHDTARSEGRRRLGGEK